MRFITTNCQVYNNSTIYDPFPIIIPFRNISNNLQCELLRFSSYVIRISSTLITWPSLKSHIQKYIYYCRTTTYEINFPTEIQYEVRES